MMNDSESIEHQLTEWVAGRPWHNTVRDECCPDFSCCNPAALWPDEMRQQFAAASNEDQQAMCFAGLGELLKKAFDGTVYLAGKEPTQ